MELQYITTHGPKYSTTQGPQSQANETFPSSKKPGKRSIEAEEWRYTGYPVFSQFVSSDNDFLIFRRFGTLGVRVLLALQDDLTLLEEELKSLDSACSERDGLQIHNGSFRTDSGSRRSKMLRGQIYEKLKMYRKYSNYISKVSSDEF